MLKLSGEGSVRTCDGVTRRDFLQAGALGALGLTLPGQLGAKAAGTASDDERSVIMIFNLGAPSQLDTFDMKPDAPLEIRGPFRSVKTRSPDIRISEILPLHALQARLRKSGPRILVIGAQEPAEAFHEGTKRAQVKRRTLVDAEVQPAPQHRTRPADRRRGARSSDPSQRARGRLHQRSRGGVKGHGRAAGGDHELLG